MEYIFIGIILVFFKTNLSFVEIGAVYYFTNILGYLFILFGVRALSKNMPEIIKIQHYIVLMIIHSSLFFMLNVTGNSPLNIALSTSAGMLIGYLGLAIIVVGEFMILYIIHRLIEVFREQINWVHIKILERLLSTLLIVFFFAGISFMINIFPVFSAVLVGILLLVQLLFLCCYYYVLLRKNRSLD